MNRKRERVGPTVVQRSGGLSISYKNGMILSKEMIPNSSSSTSGSFYLLKGLNIIFLLWRRMIAMRGVGGQDGGVESGWEYERESGIKEEGLWYLFWDDGRISCIWVRVSKSSLGHWWSAGHDYGGSTHTRLCPIVSWLGIISTACMLYWMQDIRWEYSAFRPS